MSEPHRPVQIHLNGSRHRTHVLAFNPDGALVPDPAAACTLLTVVSVQTAAKARSTLALLASTPRASAPLTVQAARSIVATARREIISQIPPCGGVYLLDAQGAVFRLPRTGNASLLEAAHQPAGTVEALLGAETFGGLLWRAHVAAIDLYGVAVPQSQIEDLGPTCQAMPGVGATIVQAGMLHPATVYCASSGLVGVKRDLIEGWASVSPALEPLPVPQPHAFSQTEWFIWDAAKGCWLGKDPTMRLSIGARNYLQ